MSDLKGTGGAECPLGTVLQRHREVQVQGGHNIMPDSCMGDLFYFLAMLRNIQSSKYWTKAMFLEEYFLVDPVSCKYS